MHNNLNRAGESWQILLVRGTSGIWNVLVRGDFYLSDSLFLKNKNIRKFKRRLKFITVIVIQSEIPESKLFKHHLTHSKIKWPSHALHLADENTTSFLLSLVFASFTNQSNRLSWGKFDVHLLQFTSTFKMADRNSAYSRNILQT